MTKYDDYDYCDHIHRPENLDFIKSRYDLDEVLFDVYTHSESEDIQLRMKKGEKSAISRRFKYEWWWSATIRDLVRLVEFPLWQADIIPRPKSYPTREEMDRRRDFTLAEIARLEAQIQKEDEQAE